MDNPFCLFHRDAEQKFNSVSAYTLQTPTDVLLLLLNRNTLCELASHLPAPIALSLHGEGQFGEDCREGRREQRPKTDLKSERKSTLHATRSPGRSEQNQGGDLTSM